MRQISPIIFSVSDSVIVGLSGGVDSAAAALLLQRQGLQVEALFMSNWDEDDAYCTQAQDFQDARKVCDRLRIPLHRASFARQYRDLVFASFLHDYARGITPNPDVLCNRHIKFGVALDHLRRLGAKFIATGHYARIGTDHLGPTLCKARDASKDQSYFLHSIEPQVLDCTLFPLGEWTKTEVRKLAHQRGLSVHDKPDSTGICFIGERPFHEFLARYVKRAPGAVETLDGEVIAEHRGLSFYTLGQRAGLRIGGRRRATPQPWYVCAKDAARNVLVVAQGHDHPSLMCSVFEVEQLRWLRAPPMSEFKCRVKVRYRQSDRACTVSWRAGRCRVTLDAPERAVTPGQYAVFYLDEQCLGGGVIHDPIRESRGEPYNAALVREA